MISSQFFIANILQWGRFRSTDLYTPVMSDTCYYQLHCATAGWVSPEQVGWTCYIIFHVAQSRSHPPDFIEGRERWGSEREEVLTSSPNISPEKSPLSLASLPNEVTWLPMSSALAAIFFFRVNWIFRDVLRKYLLPHSKLKKFIVLCLKLHMTSWQ